MPQYSCPIGVAPFRGWSPRYGQRSDRSTQAAAISDDRLDRLEDGDPATSSKRTSRGPWMTVARMWSPETVNAAKGRQAACHAAACQVAIGDDGQDRAWHAARGRWRKVLGGRRDQAQAISSAATGQRVRPVRTSASAIAAIRGGISASTRPRRAASSRPISMSPTITQSVSDSTAARPAGGVMAEVVALAARVLRGWAHLAAPAHVSWGLPDVRSTTEMRRAAGRRGTCRRLLTRSQSGVVNGVVERDVLKYSRRCHRWQRAASSTRKRPSD